MKVERVTTHIVEAPLSEPFHWSIGEASVRSSCVVEVITDTGLVGWGNVLARPGPQPL